MKKAIVIGASSGIGKGLAILLADNDYKVGITGRRTALLNELKHQRPDSFLTKTVDITDLTVAIDKLNELVHELGGLDLLVISSGIRDLNERLDFEIERMTIHTNVIGFTGIADWAFNYFEAQEFGHLVAISSVAGLRGGRHAPSYNATKAFQINYLEGLRQKAKNLNTKISVTDIRPGFVNTEMAKGEGLFWVMSVDKVVKQMLKAINGKRKVVYVTKRWGIIAAVFKLIPRFLYDRM